MSDVKKDIAICQIAIHALFLALFCNTGKCAFKIRVTGRVMKTFIMIGLKQNIKIEHYKGLELVYK